MNPIDPITGSHTQEWLVNQYNGIRERENTGYAFVSLKIKRFSQINRAYGKAAGNLLLKGLYEQLTKLLEEKEYCVRLYAGHFNLLLKLPTEDEIHTRIIEICKTVCANTPLPQMEGHLFVGIGVYPLPAKPPEFDIAQYNADLTRLSSSQREYRYSHYEIYGISFINNEELFVDLKDAVIPSLEAGEFKLYLQPKVDLCSGEILRAEALMRWIHPEKGMIPLGSILPGLEENGMIRDVDLYIFDQICSNIAKWIEKYDKKISISCNLSKAYFQDDDFIPEYKEVFEKYNIPPECIAIEFIESIVMDHVDRMKSLVKELTEIGFYCALDDFGSGYSSFNVLANVNLKELKIDRSLFADIQNKKEQIVVKHIIEVAKELGFISVAEGIEDMEYVYRLQDMGCDYIQGFVFYRPMPVAEFEERFLIKEEKVKIER